MANRHGVITTFYSYKGGTGRTMALANVAWILAANGKRVLLIDWDLEAPGLHRYFAPFLSDPDLSQTEGLVDWAYEYLVAATEPAEAEARDESASWSESYAALDGYAVPLNWQFPGEGCLHAVGAGMQNAKYSERVNRFDWFKFYAEFGGKAFVDQALEQARSGYDHIFIDSRTGVADTSGICTIQAPDNLVALFTLNNQSIEGTAEVARNAAKGRDGTEHPLRVIPVVTRVEFAEDERLKRRMARARSRFRSLLGRRDPVEYLGRLQTQYVPFYAYEEVLAAIKEPPKSRHPVLQSYLALAQELDTSVLEVPDISSAKRAEALDAYAQANAPKEDAQDGASDAGADRPNSPSDNAASDTWDVFLSYPYYAKEEAERLHRHLDSRCRAFYAERSIPVGVDRDKTVKQAYASARVHVILIGVTPPKEGDWFSNEVKAALERNDATGSPSIVPVLLAGVRFAGYLAPLAKFQFVRLAEGEEHGVAAKILESLGLQMADASVQAIVRAEKAEAAVRTLQRTVKWVAAAAAALLLIAVALLWIAHRDGTQADARAKAAEARAQNLELKATEVASTDQIVAGLQKEQQDLGARVTEVITVATAAVQSAVSRPQDEQLVTKLEEAMTGIQVVQKAVAAFGDKIYKSNLPYGPVGPSMKTQMLSVSDGMQSSLDASAQSLSAVGSLVPIQKVDPKATARAKAQALWRTGYALSNAGIVNDARKNYEAALKEDPTYAPAINSLGLLEYNLKNYSTADDWFARAVQADATYAPAFANRALSLLKLGNTAEARVQAQKALTLRPGYVSAEQAMALINQPQAPDLAPPRVLKKTVQCDRATAKTLGVLDPRGQAEANRYCEGVREVDQATLASATPWQEGKATGISFQTPQFVGKTSVWCSCAFPK